VKREDSLLSSAKDFVLESLESYRQKKLSFAILHAVTAAELLMKERLARIHPNLIFRNIDAKSFAEEDTVGLRHLSHRLTNLGVRIEPREVTLVRTIAGWRNQIVHHMPTFDPAQADHQLRRLLDFIARFLRRQLDVPLESFLPTALYRTVNGLLVEWEKVVRAARLKAKHSGKVLDLPCPACGSDLVLNLREESSVVCHLCGAKGYRYDTCTECQRKTVGRFSPFDEDNLCDDCLEAAGDRYAQSLSDRERGK
jgi:hypothetical protein